MVDGVCRWTTMHNNIDDLTEYVIKHIQIPVFPFLSTGGECG